MVLCDYDPARLQAQAFDEFPRDGGDPFAGSQRKALVLVGVHVAYDNPQSRAIDFIVSRANRAGKLLHLQRVLIRV
jgi:hypothetical protein